MDGLILGMMKTNRLANLFLAAILFAPAGALNAATPKVGDTAPQFTGTDQYGKTIKLADLIGKKVVLLYFYPMAFTPGCTTEACGFRDRMAGLKKQDVEVIGVSFDTVKRQHQFTEHYHLNFPLIADPHGKIADLYGVRMKNRKLARRVSFLIGLNGKIAHVTDSPNPETHFEQMKAAIAALKKG